MKSYLLPILCFFLFSCTDNSTKRTENNFENETPAVLVKESFGDFNSDIFDSYKRYDEGIISSLYNEALKKDADLSELNRRIFHLDEAKYDSLATYERYDGITSGYWTDAYNHISQLNDTLLKESVRNHFMIQHADFDSTIVSLRAKKDSIEKRTRALDDQLILLKLHVTERMIKNFQKNEMPDIEQMERVLREYERMIEEVKQVVAQ